MYKKQMLNAQAVMGEGVTRVIASFMDPDRVDEYLRDGENAPGYWEAEQAMAQVRDSSADISYVYIYQVRPDGCHGFRDVAHGGDRERCVREVDCR